CLPWTIHSTSAIILFAVFCHDRTARAPHGNWHWHIRCSFRTGVAESLFSDLLHAPRTFGALLAFCRHGVDFPFSSSVFAGRSSTWGHSWLKLSFHPKHTCWYFSPC